MSEAKLRALKTLTAADSAETEAYHRGRREGYQAAREELFPQVEKIASEAISAMEKRSHQLSAFKGKVAAHAACLVIARAKESMANGVCWQCRQRPIEPSSTYMRCASCDSEEV